MNLRNGKITILINKHETEIQIHDGDAGLEFVTVTLTPEQLSMALSRQGYVSCDIEVRGLENVGKKMEVDKLSVELPDVYEGLTERDAIAKKLVKHQCPEGWEPYLYFGSQTSFTSEAGKCYAHTVIRRWV